MRRGMSHAIRTDRSRRHGQFAKWRSAGRGSGGPRSEWEWSASSGDGPFALSCPARLRQPPAAAELDAGPGLPSRTPGAGEAAGADTRRRPRELRRQEERVPGHRAPPAVRGHQVRWVALSPAPEPRTRSRSRASCPLFLFSKCLHVPSSVSSPCQGDSPAVAGGRRSAGQSPTQVPSLTREVPGAASRHFLFPAHLSAAAARSSSQVPSAFPRPCPRE